MNTKKVAKRHANYLVPSLLLILFLVSTEPQKLQVFILIVPLLLIFIASYNFFKVLFNRTPAKQIQDRGKGVALSLALITLALCALQLIGQLTVKDGLLFAILALIAGGYINRTN